MSALMYTDPSTQAVLPVHLELLRCSCSFSKSVHTCRVLLFGVPSDKDAAASLREAAVSIAQSICKSGQAASSGVHTEQSQGALEALLIALMCGLASLTEEQLNAAAKELLRLAGRLHEDTAVGQLSQQMRSADMMPDSIVKHIMTCKSGLTA